MILFGLVKIVLAYGFPVWQTECTDSEKYVNGSFHRASFGYWLTSHR